MEMTTTALAAAAGISKPYASQILSGKRIPPVGTAARIFLATGWKHPSFEGVSDEALTELAKVAA